MPRKSKKFIDRKHAVTFHLVHRSQQDPLIAVENAPQRVLVQEISKHNKQIDEQHRYGIFFDDDYNYLQHLRDTNNTMELEKVNVTPNNERKLNLPSSVFASNVEEDVGLLNKAAVHSGPRPDFDPDVIAALDEDFDYSNPENQLEDNFMELANGDCSSSEEDDYDSSSIYDSDEERDEVASLNNSQFSYTNEEVKSRFTDYSMTSSVIRRNEQLTLLDNRFEKIFSGYDENEIGALDCEEIQGHVPENSDLLLQFAEEFQKQQKRDHLDKDINNIELEDELDGETELVPVNMHENEKWDCETILSTYSNIYNHPKLITEPKIPKIKINSKTGMPMDVLGTNKLTAKALAKLDEENEFKGYKGPPSTGAQSIVSILSTLSIRAKDETAEERKKRKKLLKDYRKERRLEKKANSVAFKDEIKRQMKISINNRNNVQGNKIL